MIDVICILLVTLVFLAVVYALLLVRPRKRKLNIVPFLVDYAHRGLHNTELPENSLAAFENAVKNGYGIELDVQLSKDGEVMVFHDYTLTRMTESEELVSALTKNELKTLSLKNTAESIPTLSEVLELVKGQVPLLIELKGEDLNTSLCKYVADILAEYSGVYCIESFNPLLIRKMKKYLPNAFYGQLYTNVCREHGRTPVNIALTAMALNFLSNPDFIAYNKVDRNSFPVKLTTKFYKAPRFVWTVKTAEEMNDAEKFGECAIFEK